MKITYSDKHGYNLRQLLDILGDAATRAPEDAKVTATITWGGVIKSLTVEDDRS